MLTLSYSNTCSPFSNTCSPVANTCSLVVYTCSPLANTCSPVANMCSPVANKCSPIGNMCSPLANTCSPAHCNYFGPMTPGTVGLPANFRFLRRPLIAFIEDTHVFCDIKRAKRAFIYKMQSLILK